MRRTTLPLGLLALLAALQPLTPAAPANAAGTADAAESTLLFWSWTDGSTARERRFDAADYPDPERLPRLVVVTEPAAPRRTVRLQFRDGPRWRDDDVAVTDTAGRATLDLNPVCPDGRWCARTFAYRLLADGRVSAFRLGFAR